MYAETDETKAPRMSLKNVVKGKIETPLRTLLYGVEGIGKSTFGANAEAPIFLCAEDGTAQLDVQRFPEPQTWTEVFQAVTVLIQEEHDRKTLVVDTLDWLEPLNWAHVCAKGKKQSIEDFGYGKGYTAALDEWRRFARALDRLRGERAMNIILLAHSWVKTFKNPEGEDYDRYNMKLHDKAGGFLREWCDVALFANYETYTHEDKGRAKGVSTGARVMHSERCAAWDAKNRYDLPPTMPLDFEEYIQHVRSHQPASPDKLRTKITELLPGADETTRAKVEGAVASAGDNAAELARIHNKLSAIVNIND